MAKFDLSGLLLGQRVLHLRSPVHCCPLPDTNAGHEKPSGPIVGRPGNVDGPGKVDSPMMMMMMTTTLTTAVVVVVVTVMVMMVMIANIFRGSPAAFCELLGGGQ